MRSFHAATGGSTAPGGVVGPSGARILVVEDERVLALDRTETLDELGYTVAGTATRGEEAIELARRLHPHLILMDVGLPLKGASRCAKRVTRRRGRARTSTAHGVRRNAALGGRSGLTRSPGGLTESA